MRVIRMENISPSARVYFKSESTRVGTVYFNYEEFDRAVKEGKEVCNYLFKNAEDLMNYCNNNPEIFRMEVEETASLGIWLATKDNYVPDYFDAIDGECKYLVDYQGRYIPTDGCIIKLLRVRRKGYIYAILTINGSQAFTIFNKGRLPLTAALMPKVAVEVGRITKGQYKQYKDMKVFRKYVRMSYTYQEMQMIYNALNPLSPYFLNWEKSISQFMKIKDKGMIERYIKSNKFRRLLMQQLKILIPELASALREAIPATDIANYLKKAIEKALKEETTEDVRANIEYVIKLAYESAMNDMRQTTIDTIPEPLSISTTDKKSITSGKSGIVVDEFNSISNDENEIDYTNELIDEELEEKSEDIEL